MWRVPQRAEVEKTEKQLVLFSETLEEWLNVQKNWMYLESIFSSPDIQRQLPQESKIFQSVNIIYRESIRKVMDRPNALATGTSAGWLEQF